MSRIYFCSLMLAEDTSSAMNVWPRPSTSWLDPSSAATLTPPACGGGGRCDVLADERRLCRDGQTASFIQITL